MFSEIKHLCSVQTNLRLLVTGLSPKNFDHRTSDQCERSLDTYNAHLRIQRAQRTSGPSLIGSTDRPLQPRFALIATRYQHDNQTSHREHDRSHDDTCTTAVSPEP